MGGEKKKKGVVYHGGVVSWWGLGGIVRLLGDSRMRGIGGVGVWQLGFYWGQSGGDMNS